MISSITFSTIFDEASVKIRKADEESATISYAAKQRLELLQVEQPMARRQRIETLVKFFIDEALEKKKMEV